jgi:hypothetical protein
MRHIKMVVLVALVLVAASCVVVSSAVALPSILVLPTESGSLLLESLANTLLTTLDTEVSGALKGEGLLVGLHFPNTATNLGTYELLFNKLNFEVATNHCQSMGDGETLVLFPHSTFHLVFDSLTVLGVAALFLVPSFQFVCKTKAAEITVTVGGNLLALVTPLNTELLVGEEFRSTTRCASGNTGRPADATWWNGSGVLQSALLAANVGLGAEQACVNVAGTVLLSTSRMAEIMG